VLLCAHVRPEFDGPFFIDLQTHHEITIAFVAGYSVDNSNCEKMILKRDF
jgi:hypothetical protein